MNSLALLPTCTSLPCPPSHPDTKWADDIYTRLLDAIVEQRLAPGCRLTEESLGQMFGASRAHVRDALSLLSYQQVITVQANARTRVASPTDEQIRQALHARRLTEMALIPMACRHPQKQDLQHLRQLLANLRLSQSENRRGVSIRLAGAFHLHLAQMAGNAPLAYFLGNLLPLTSLAIAPSTDTWQQQAAIAQAVEDQDATTAARLINLYLDGMVPGCTTAPPFKLLAAQNPRGFCLQAGHRQ